jgi:hypothetical protein
MFCLILRLCVTIGTKTPVEDAQVFSLLGNPTNADFSVLDFGNNISLEKNITMTNAVGQLVHQWNVNSNETTFKVQTTDLQSGMYFVTVKVGNRYFTRKLVK